MTPSDPRKEYLSRIQLSESNVNLTPSIVFLFGGSTRSANTVRTYLRDHIRVNRPALASSLLMPEDFDDWLHDAVYPDLLTFEQDLAHTASLIVIALESPGSIAELGCFSVNASLKSKLMIILSERHHRQPSFIKQGPLRQVGEDSVYAYPYASDDIPGTFPEFVDEAVIGIEDRLDAQRKTVKFDPSLSGHQAFLIFEFISIFKALRITEIQNFLDFMQIDIPQQDLKRLLFLLEKLGLVTAKKRGNLYFYIPKKEQVRINFSNKAKTLPFERGAASIGAIEYYSANPKESLRMKLIESSLRGGVAP